MDGNDPSLAVLTQSALDSCSCYGRHRLGAAGLVEFCGRALIAPSAASWSKGMGSRQRKSERDAEYRAPCPVLREPQMRDVKAMEGFGHRVPQSGFRGCPEDGAIATRTAPATLALLRCRSGSDDYCQNRRPNMAISERKGRSPSQSLPSTLICSCNSGVNVK
jgi:hypothetical protein